MSTITLNSDQDEIASIILNKLSKGEQILAFVTGRAGTGKSALIRHINQNLVNLRAIVCAFTNQAARNINGCTIHVAFKWRPWSMKHEDDACVHKYDLLIVDEVSMISSTMLAAMESSLRRKANNRKPFGGKSIILFGDFNQLPPVLAQPAYKSFLWKYFQRHAYSLTKNMRQDQREFDAACLYYILSGKISPVLSACIDKRSIMTITNEMSSDDIKSTSFLFYRNIDSDAQNMRVVRKMKHVPVMCKNTTWTENLPPKVKEDIFYIGARYTARETASASLKNKDGSVRESAVYKGNLYTLTGFKGYIAQIVDADNNEYALPRQTLIIKRRPKTTNQSMPLILAYASTVHKAQGSSYDAVVVDPAHMSRQLFYVAISRCRTVERLKILGRIPVGPYDPAKVENEVYRLQVETPPDVYIDGPDETSRVNIVDDMLDENASVVGV